MPKFMDKYNHDEERLRRCDIHYLSPDVRIIPFCAFNVIPEWSIFERQFDVQENSATCSRCHWFGLTSQNKPSYQKPH